MIVPVVIAGGSGSRLWPLSRQVYPKQLFPLIDDKTLFQNTILRLQGIEDIGDPVVVCNENHRFMIAEQLRSIEIDKSLIILEPVGRNTAPALCIASLKVLESGADPVLLILPADHDIKDTKRFHDAVHEGRDLALAGSLVTFGIVPKRPETGYGYIKKGDCLKQGHGEVVKIDSFVEKPNLETAVKYVESGDYCWNSGMFMFRASSVIREFERYRPDMLAACKDAVGSGYEDLDFFRMSRDIFEKCPSDSIDYALMEKTDNGVMVSLDARWSDLGAWNALWETGDKDGSGNVLQGDVVLHDVKDSLISSRHRLVAAVGIENCIIVETADAVMVASTERAGDVKKIVEQMKQNSRDEVVYHKKIYRPWGSFETMDEESRFQVKRIVVNPGARFALQKHYNRAEHWVVVAGTAIVVKDDDEVVLSENQSTYIPPGVTHSLKNPGCIPLHLIEIQSGSYLGEDDIERFEDLYS